MARGLFPKMEPQLSHLSKKKLLIISLLTVLLIGATVTVAYIYSNSETSTSSNNGSSTQPPSSSNSNSHHANKPSQTSNSTLSNNNENQPEKSNSTTNNNNNDNNNNNNNENHPFNDKDDIKADPQSVPNNGSTDPNPHIPSKEEPGMLKEQTGPLNSSEPETAKDDGKPSEEEPGTKKKVAAKSNKQNDDTKLLKVENPFEDDQSFGKEESDASNSDGVESENELNAQSSSSKQQLAIFDPFKYEADRFYFIVATEDPGSTIASISSDGSDYRIETKLLFDPQSSNFDNGINMIEFSNVTGIAVVRDNSLRIGLIDFQHPEKTKILDLNLSFYCSRLKFSPDGKNVLCFHNNAGKMSIFDFENPSYIKTIDIAEDVDLYSIAFEPDGKSVLYTKSESCFVERFNFETYEGSTVFHIESKLKPKCASLSPDGEIYAVISVFSDTNQISLYNVKTQAKKTYHLPESIKSKNIKQIFWSSDGKQIFAFCRGDQDHNYGQLHIIKINNNTADVKKLTNESGHDIQISLNSISEF